jgi:hypothetical protein
LIADAYKADLGSQRAGTTKFSFIRCVYAMAIALDTPDVMCGSDRLCTQACETAIAIAVVQTMRT